MSRDALAAQKSHKESELSANQSRLANVEAKLGRVRQAKLEIAELKNDGEAKEPAGR